MRRAKPMRRPHADARSPNGGACRCAAIHGVDRWRSTASEGANAGTSGGNEVERRRSSRRTAKPSASARASVTVRFHERKWRGVRRATAVHPCARSSATERPRQSTGKGGRFRAHCNGVRNGLASRPVSCGRHSAARVAIRAHRASVRAEWPKWPKWPKRPRQSKQSKRSKQPKQPKRQHRPKPAPSPDQACGSTRSTSLPRWLPSNRRFSTSGALVSPSATVSSAFSRPSRSQPASVAIASRLFR
ncbi:oxidoreductase, zinc-binding dehydrogenase family domain protein [Burkholderia pseudomallei MSHR4462]|nr:oxidoreductase, zinc-binding dehydrogenase family domain protein [Burkholderia pseudomallei MSHR4462]KGX01307.1 oxidoreductase, zinc-binding dehydrogenase family domain protein [Burkholderia pseudomallei MSHR640]